MTYHKQDLRPPINNRLKRFVGGMPQACTFDPIHNLLCINPEVYQSLNQKRRERLWRATKDMTIQEARE